MMNWLNKLFGKEDESDLVIRAAVVLLPMLNAGKRVEYYRQGTDIRISVSEASASASFSASVHGVTSGVASNNYDVEVDE